MVNKAIAPFIYWGYDVRKDWLPEPIQIQAGRRQKNPSFGLKNDLE